MERSKVMRAIKKLDPQIVEEATHLLRPHTATPSVGRQDLLNIVVKGKNKWLTLIQNASSG